MNWHFFAVWWVMIPFYLFWIIGMIVDFYKEFGL